MTPNALLWNQLSGNVVQAIIQGIQNKLNEDAALIGYWESLTIGTALDVDGTLNYVGAITGYPRPVVSDVFFETNVLQFTDANIAPPSYTRTDLTFLAGDNSVNTAGGNFIAAGFAVGQWIIISGSVSNNYTVRITKVTAAKIIYTPYTTIAEADANSITMTIAAQGIGFDDASFPSPLNSPYVFNAAAGQFDDAQPLATHTMPSAWYQSMLAVFAIAKYYGPTIYTIDQVASWANTQGGGSGYTISRDSYKNIIVAFTTPIDERALTIFNMIWQDIETLPLVTGEQP